MADYTERLVYLVRCVSGTEPELVCGLFSDLRKAFSLGEFVGTPLGCW